MMIASKSQKYKKLVSENQDLIFEYTKKKLKEKDIIFDVRGSALLNSDGKYNNAALLLINQNPTISKFAVFQGTDVSVFLDKKEFKGSIMKQLDDILYFANLSNKKKIIITGKPQRALREAICNSFCHRDYSLSGDIKVEYYDDRVMIFSPGSLPNGLTVENIKKSMTSKRNQILVDALDKADFIENCASGVRRIFKDYKSFDKKPEYNTSDNSVILTLYNRNYDNDNVVSDVANYNVKNLKSKDRQKFIVKQMSSNSKITISELSDIFQVSSRTIQRDIEKLKKENKIERTGSLIDGDWILK